MNQRRHGDAVAKPWFLSGQPVLNRQLPRWVRSSAARRYVSVRRAAFQIVAVFVMAALLSAVSIVAAMRTRTWPSVACAVVFGAWMLWIVRDWMQLRRDALLTSQRRAGACRKCGYALDTLPRNDEGFVVCPECGAEWAEVRPGR